ncbi:MAG: penicillin-binding protein 2, partial [Ruminococcus sp.]|nr:penicillin-binding protein 2 [Ruminococcus sp.]
MRPLVNTRKQKYAFVIPYYTDMPTLRSYAADKKEFDTIKDCLYPVAFRSNDDITVSGAVTVIEIPERNSEDQPAQHVIGYLSDGKGASGLEYAYDKILRSGNGENSMTYTCDGFSRVLIGDRKVLRTSNADIGGVVTTIDLDIQKICESAGEKINKGAIVLSDVYSGDIIALASFPSYSPNNIEAAIKDERSPLINRALYSYSVGSIFKLVTACEAINEGKNSYIYECSGKINVKGQCFNCHKYDGHGKENITSAITDSCNTYFIALSRRLDVKKLRKLANDLGFGKEITLCTDIAASPGVLPTENDLNIPAELANFSFGQGKLSATPLQINRMTCTIANGGEVPMLRLVKGITVDGINIANDKMPHTTRAISDDAAVGLRRMMTAAIRDNVNSKAQSEKVSIAAKTSTAQTGRFDEEGNEYCHGWITGFFPANSPRYALTVLVEDGGYGNDSAAPIFKEIAEKITEKGLL